MVYCWGLNDLGQLGDGSTTNNTAASAAISNPIPRAYAIDYPDGNNPLTTR